jgi:hypothetical protein
MVCRSINSSSPPPMLLPQHVSVIWPSSCGIQYYTVSSFFLDCNSCYLDMYSRIVVTVVVMNCGYRGSHELIKQLMVRHRNNSSSLPMLLPQHVSVIWPSLCGIQYYTVSSFFLDCNSCYLDMYSRIVVTVVITN